MPRTAALVLLLLLAACGEDRESPPASPPPPHAASAVETEEAAGAPEVLSEKWYSERLDGQHCGWLHVVWTRSRYEDRETIHDRTERYRVSTRSAIHAADRFEARTVIDVERLPDGSLLTMRATVMQGDRPLVTEQRFTGDGYEWEQRVAGQVERRRVDCDRPVPTDGESFLAERIAGREISSGTVFTYPAPDFREGTLRTIRLTAEGYETLPSPTGPCRCLRVKEVLVGSPATSVLWLDGEGVLRKLESDGMVLESTTREKACEQSPAGYRYSVVLPAEPVMLRATSLDRAVVEVALREAEGVAPPDFPDSPFSREVSRDGLRHVIELKSHEAPEATVQLPVTSPDVSRWLETNALFCADSPEVRAAARGAIGEETDGRTAAKKLLAFVFTHLAKGSGPIPEPNAVEILRDGGGDCSEHAVLFVALCRAVGLPARRVSGYAQVGDVWGSHSFTEVWLGKWVGADPSTNELGTKARYLCFGWPDEPDSYPDVVTARVRSRMRIRTLEFEERGQTLEVANLPEGDGRTDPLSGLSFSEAPEAWTAGFSDAPGTGWIRGPGVSCSVRVRSGYGDLPTEILGPYFMPFGVSTEFGGVPALCAPSPDSESPCFTLLVPYRRRFLEISVVVAEGVDGKAALETIAAILAPTL